MLDVQDDNPLPRRPELNSAFHRSILILTPQRALKFTATSAERHGLWMTALSFLAESTRMQTQLPPLPLVPPIPNQSQPSKSSRDHSPSFGRAKIRDSVRLTQGKLPNLLRSVSQQEVEQSLNFVHPDLNEGAEFPAIPRLYSNTNRHQRKRSNTSPRLPPALNNLRSFSSSAVPSLTAPSNLYVRSASSSKPPTVLSTSSRSGSHGGSIVSPIQANFFEAVGTVRMEAFVDPSVRNGVMYVPAPPPTGPMHRRHRGYSNLSSSTVDQRRAGYVFDENGVDPFKGF